MRRTQIQLDEETYSTLKRLAYEGGRSFSSVVRETLQWSLGARAGRRAKPRKPGAWKGRIVIAADFDAPLPERLLAAFRGAGR